MQRILHQDYYLSRMYLRWNFGSNLTCLSSWPPGAFLAKHEFFQVDLWWFCFNISDLSGGRARMKPCWHRCSQGFLSSNKRLGPATIEARFTRTECCCSCPFSVVISSTITPVLATIQPPHSRPLLPHHSTRLHRILRQPVLGPTNH